MEPLTRDDCLRMVKEHFQRPEAVLAYDSDLGSCVYRGGQASASPVRCPFGVLIPDELYQPEMENIVASALYLGGAGRFPAIRPLFAADVSPEWLNRLQETHDGLASADRSVGQFLELLDERIATGVL